MDKQRLLAGLQGEDRALAARVLDLAGMALDKAEPVATDFLNPGEKKLLQDLLHFAEEIKVMVFGGYHQAERVRLVLLPAFFLPEAVSPPLAYLEVKGNSKKDFQPNHRDLLGSLTGLGIKREKIGDILPVDGGAQVILAKEIEEYALTHLSRVGTVRWRWPVDPSNWNIQPQRVKEVTPWLPYAWMPWPEPVLGFPAQKWREIKAERVKVNWKIVPAPITRWAWDTISIRGRDG